MRLNVDIVRQAERELTRDQRATIGRRYENIQATQSDHLSPPPNPEGAEPTSRKGKGPDPRNWGNIGWDNDELRPEVQQAIL